MMPVLVGCYGAAMYLLGWYLRGRLEASNRRLREERRSTPCPLCGGRHGHHFATCGMFLGLPREYAPPAHKD